MFLWESSTCRMSAGNNMLETRQSERFLECVEENDSVGEQLTKGGAPLDLLFAH